MENSGNAVEGIVHDLNNLLTGIIAQNSLALRQKGVDLPAARKHVETALWAAQQAAYLTRRLAEGDEPGPLRPVDLNCLARRNARIWASVFAPRVTLLTRLAEDTPPIMADEGQVQRLLMNLVINAAESYEGKRGQVEIATAVTEITTLDDAWHFFTDTFPPGLYVRLTVADKGKGMDAAALEHIFDPFYSTKAAGRGLGLSTIQATLRRHRGAICIESEPGNGTVFHLLFPAVPEVSLPLSDDVTTIDLQPLEEGCVVLIGEDERVIRKSLSDAFQLVGCRPLTAVDGDAIWDRFAAAPQEIDLVILDVTMPGLSGPELYEQIRRARPDVPVIFLSGQGKPDFLKNLNTENVRFLRKPFDIHVLLKEAKKMLRRPLTSTTAAQSRP